MLTHMSLCSGIGGIDLAAEWAGFKTLAQCEVNEFASKVLAKNFKGVHNFGDIRTITNATVRSAGIDPAEITVLSAGFPCQPYSLAGKGLGDRDERDLWGEVRRIIGELRPRWFVGENTPGLFARKNQRYFRRILNDLTALGYSVSWGIWGACDVGAPHQRKRVFLVAWDTHGKHDETEPEVCPQNDDALGIRGKIPDAVSKRRNPYEIQRGESAESWRTTHARRIQVSGVQSCGIRSNLSKLCRGWQAEPDVGRVANGVSARVDRLRCLGNAVVPQQVYPIFKAISQIELTKQTEVLS